ncbi:MAG TPA: ADP-ribosylglycohydrolase family protein [Phycisphaerales bacterium]|nr:ADP-ribosylglycohydrolase family protein [Phycisphaerales bacterium]
MDSAKHRFQGCLLGLALGDAVNAPFEGGVLERLLWRLIGRTKAGEMRWTDDTQMSIDVLESLVVRGSVDPDDLAARFAGSYRWTRGYGPGTAKVLARISRGEHWERANTAGHRDGSFGNGAAMRAPMIGLFYAERTAEIDDAARRSAIVTHSHSLGIDGAVLIARATAAAFRAESSSEVLRIASDYCHNSAMSARLQIAKGWLMSRSDVTPAEVARNLGNGISAVDSCVTALYLALRFREAGFIELQKMVATIRGDADTIGAMAGAIWGAANGILAIPQSLLQQLEQRERLMSLAEVLCQRATLSRTA